MDSVNKLAVPFPRTSYIKNSAVVTAAKPFGTAYPVTLEGPVLEINF